MQHQINTFKQKCLLILIELRLYKNKGGLNFY